MTHVVNSRKTTFDYQKSGHCMIKVRDMWLAISTTYGIWQEIELQ